MAFELPLATFTLLHVGVSLAGIVAGLVVLHGMLGSRRLPGWTALFLLTTALTSITGLLFPNHGITPAQIFGYLLLALIAVTLVALYAFRLVGMSRWIYVICAVAALYLNVFVAVVQAFAKIPALQSLAPTQSEPPFVVTEAVVLAAFVMLGAWAVVKFHPERLCSRRWGRSPRSSCTDPKVRPPASSTSHPWSQRRIS